MLAAEAVSCLNKALYHLKDIWEEIGIPEDQRLQRTNVVKNHVKVRQIKTTKSLNGILLTGFGGRGREGGRGLIGSITNDRWKNPLGHW